jgi:tetratricopeptide (TPR) repeat protein
MDLGRTEEAVQTLQRATKAPKPVSESFYLLGQAQVQAGAYAQARESFQRAIALVPDHTQAFFGLYTACMRLGLTNQANEYREQFQKLEAVDRRFLADRSAREDTLTGLPFVRKTVARSLFGAAQLYRAHQESSKAAELYFRAALLDADSLTYRAALHAHYAKENQLTEAVGTFQKLVTAQPTNALNYIFLGRAQSRLEQDDVAEQAYKKAQELAPNWAEGYRALAELYVRGNRKPSQARTLAEQAVKLEPSAGNYYLFAVACIQNDDRPGAIAAMKEAVSLNPGEKRYQEYLEKLKAQP